MKLIVKKTLRIQGELTPPSSKSQSIRALFIATMARGESRLINVLQADDTDSAISVCKALGASITKEGDDMIVRSEGVPLHLVNETLETGNSGITTRFVLPLLGLRNENTTPVTLTCGAQMQARPIRSLVEVLNQLGLRIEYAKEVNKLPLRIRGELLGGEGTVDGITSQYITALLLSLPLAEKDSVIRVTHLHERPYAEMTLQCLDSHGIRYEHTRETDLDIFKIPGRQHYRAKTQTIPGDFSSASYLIAAACLFPGTTILHGLDMQDPQGDKRLVPILQAMGADIQIANKRLTIHGGKPLQGIDIDANDIPDLLPTLAVIGTVASGQTCIKNVPQARLKETDRIHSMCEGLSRMRAKVEEYPDGLTVYQSALKGHSVKGYEDHRTVMALSLAGMLAEGETIIDDADAINKTFPTFVETMHALGANLEKANVIA